MKNFSNTEWLVAIRETLINIDGILPKDKSERIKNLVEPLFEHVEEPDDIAEAIAQSLEVIQEYPEANDDLKKRLLGIDSTRGDVLPSSGYEPTPGKGDPISFGEDEFYVCPKDPTHLRTTRRIKGQQCPQHQVELVPESSILPRDK
jgi:hypothetical protein